MLDAEKLATIDQNTDIIIGGVYDAGDSINKALELVTDLKSKYGFSSGTKPSNKVPDKLNWPMYSGEDTDIHNSSIWICHYEKIMLKLDMIEDYLQKGVRGTEMAFEGVNGINGATGETLLTYLAGLEKVGAAR